MRRFRANWGRFAVTQNEKIGLGVLVAFFIALAIALVMTFKPMGPRTGGTPEDSVIVQQRIKNLQK